MLIILTICSVFLVFKLIFKLKLSFVYLQACTKMTTTNNNFRRGQSKIYYASDVWDPGEDFARTSFRSSCSEDESYGNNEDFVASLMRRTINHEDQEYIMNEEEPFIAVPTYAKPLPLLGHPSRHSVLNR